MVATAESTTEPQAAPTPQLLLPAPKEDIRLKQVKYPNLNRAPKGYQIPNKGKGPRVPQEIKDVAKAYTLEAMGVLINWMRSDNPAASLKATEMILDRGWGKAVIHLNTEEKVEQDIEITLTIDSKNDPGGTGE